MIPYLDIIFASLITFFSSDIEWEDSIVVKEIGATSSPISFITISDEEEETPEEYQR